MEEAQGEARSPKRHQSQKNLEREECDVKLIQQVVVQEEQGSTDFC